jgi:hypothetical protein
MTHDGRMERGKDKIARGLSDIETEYYLANKPKEINNGKPKSGRTIPKKPSTSTRNNSN